MNDIFDVAIIGGGINGCGIAADAASRGLSVILIEKDDIASKTSSSSTKLIHGGLRYLEQGELRLVKKALKERAILLNCAPHLVKPLSLVLPKTAATRPAFILQLGLFLYDRITRKNTLPKSQAISRSHQPDYFNPLKSSFNTGFLYHDATTDDARLTLCNALQAEQWGAIIKTRHELISATTYQGEWKLTIRNSAGETEFIYAKSVINAAGPWVLPVNQRLSITNQYPLTLVKGSHLVVKQCYQGEHAYLLQHEDKRVIFIIPYQGFTLIGTTDVDYHGALDNLEISEEETQYLLNIVNDYFNQSVTRADIVSSWSGVRPLPGDKKTALSTMSRDYLFHQQQFPAPSITVYGGKITTYRILAEEVVNHLKKTFINLGPSKTAYSPLPGGVWGKKAFEEYATKLKADYPFIDDTLMTRYLNQYGTRTKLLLKNCNEISALGLYFGHGLYQIEIDFLIHYEWAKTSDDILLRRTKLGLYFTDEQRNNLACYLKKHVQTLPISTEKSSTTILNQS